MKTYTSDYVRKFLEDFLGFCNDYHYYMYVAHDDRGYYSYEDIVYMHKTPKDLYTTRARVLSKLVFISDVYDKDFTYICETYIGDFKDIEPEYVIKYTSRSSGLSIIRGARFPTYLLPVYYIMTLYRCALFRQDSETIDKLFSWYRDYILDYLNTGVFEKEVDKMVEYYTAEEENGELVAWLLEFKKNRFGFQGSDELSL